jgi:hypothetical protein
MLSNRLGGEAANTIVSAAKEKPQLMTLCGPKPDQTEADFLNRRLGVGDATLLAFNLSKNSVLVTLKCVA